MINENIKNLLTDSTSSIVTPFKNISMVFEDNTIAHAMLILRESNYTQIPVLNYDKKFIGLISLHQIYKKLGEDLFKNFENLENILVKDAIDFHFASIKEDYEIEDVLRLLIDYNFVNILNDNDQFVGMITRSSILKKFNYFSHLHE